MDDKSSEYDFFIVPTEEVEQQEKPLIVVDDVSLDKIRGSLVDFVEDMSGKRFQVLSNPNAEKSCGCGSSFAPK